MKSAIRWGGLILALVSAAQVHAVSVSYFMNQSNELADGPNYLQVTIDDNGAPGSINFKVETLPVLTGMATGNFGLQSFGFNTTLSSGLIASASISGLPAGWTANVAPRSNTRGGFGKFDIAVNDTGQNRASVLTFSVTGIAGDTVLNYAKLSSGTAGEGNVFFAAHVAGFNDGNSATSAFFGGSTLVPLPGAVWLLGSGLLGLVAFARRKKNGFPPSV